MAVSNALRKAVENSAGFAMSVGESKIETEHLLYGILSVDSKASKLLASVGLQANSYKKVILSYLKKKSSFQINEVGYSKSVSAIFAKTTDFCRKNGRETLENEDILYILLLNEGYKATKCLKNMFKINIDILKQKLENIM